MMKHRVLWAGLIFAAACSDAATSPSTRTVAWRLQLNHHAVTLATVAPYDTIHLVATVVDQHGDPIATTARPVYTINDTSLIIDSTGLVHVHWTGSNALNVTVAVTLGTAGAQATTLVDTAVFNVVQWNSTAAVPMLDSLVFRPLPGDSARRALFDTLGPVNGGVPPQALDSPVVKTALGVPLDDVVVRYRSSDSLIASIVTPIGDAMAAPQVQGNSPGVVLLTAEATVYGRRRVDSLWYTVGYPLRVLCAYGITGGGQAFGLAKSFPSVPVNVLSLGTLMVGQGGAVVWENTLSGTADDSLDIQFDDSTHVAGLTQPITFPDFYAGVTIPPGPGGNMLPFPAAVPQFAGPFYVITSNAVTSKARVFPQPGTYHWSSQRHGIQGTVIVVPNDSLHPR